MGIRFRPKCLDYSVLIENGQALDMQDALAKIYSLYREPGYWMVVKLPLFAGDITLYSRLNIDNVLVRMRTWRKEEAADSIGIGPDGTTYDYERLSYLRKVKLL